MHLHRKAFPKYFVPQSLHKALPISTLYYKACAMYVPVRLCTTKLAQSTSQYYFVLQSLHKALPSTTLYYKACTKHVPALLCTTQLAQNTFFIAGCSHFTPKNAQFRAFLPKKTTCNTHAAITMTMRFATTASETPCNCNVQGHAKHIEAAVTLRTTPRLGRTQPAPAANTRYFIAGCCDFTRKNARFRSPASSPTQVPCNSHAAIIVITSIRHHFSSSPLPFVTTSLGPHFQKSLYHPAWMYCFVM